ncbi:hypothetical protein FQZ97_933860 [compost metagenome]
MDHQVRHRGVQRDQRLAEVGDVAVVDLFHQAMGQVGLVEQRIEAVVPVQQPRRAEEELLGHVQHRRDLRLDSGLARHAVCRFEEVRHLVDVGVDEARQHAEGIAGVHGDAGVQPFQLGLDQPGQMAVAGLQPMGVLDQFAKRSGVHDNSKTTRFGRRTLAGVRQRPKTRFS